MVSELLMISHLNLLVIICIPSGCEMKLTGVHVYDHVVVHLHHEMPVHVNDSLIRQGVDQVSIFVIKYPFLVFHK